MNKIEVKKGYTNSPKFIDGDKFIITKTYTGFNHHIDYSVLKDFDFVPELISDSKDEIVWKVIKGESLHSFTSDDIATIASYLSEVHNSDIKLPAFNIQARTEAYLKQLKEKGEHVVEIDRNLDKMMDLLANMRRDIPMHSDMLADNVMKDVDGKLWLVDWEYANMGDNHFELAYFCEAGHLNDAQVAQLIHDYNKVSAIKVDPALLEKHRRFCNWLTILWAHVQTVMPFDLTGLKAKL